MTVCIYYWLVADDKNHQDQERSKDQNSKYLNPSSAQQGHPVVVVVVVAAAAAVAAIAAGAAIAAAAAAAVVVVVVVVVQVSESLVGLAESSNSCS